MAEYQSYIEYEIKDGDPARVQIIFERALGENCLVPDLWAKYTIYLVRHIKMLLGDIVSSRSDLSYTWGVGDNIIIDF